jgi:hypothetical protein
MYQIEFGLGLRCHAGRCLSWWCWSSWSQFRPGPWLAWADDAGLAGHKYWNPVLPELPEKWSDVPGKCNQPEVVYVISPNTINRVWCILHQSVLPAGRTADIYICLSVYSPLGLVGNAKHCSSHLTWTAWVQFPPFPDADYLLCWSS